jgi:hypothetical protein
MLGQTRACRRRSPRHTIVAPDSSAQRPLFISYNGLMRRHIMGFLGLVLFIAGACAFTFGIDDGFFAGAGVRAGAVLLVLWLAWPQLIRIPPWVFVGGFIAAAVIAIRPSWAIWVIPILVVLWLVMPRWRQEGASNSRT